jgi:hypothetical protein
MLVSGTAAMLPRADQFGDAWRVKIANPVTSSGTDAEAIG